MSTPSERRKLGLPPVNLISSTPSKPPVSARLSAAEATPARAERTPAAAPKGASARDDADADADARFDATPRASAAPAAVPETPVASAAAAVPVTPEPAHAYAQTSASLLPQVVLCAPEARAMAREAATSPLAPRRAEAAGRDAGTPLAPETPACAATAASDAAADDADEPAADGVSRAPPMPVTPAPANPTPIAAGAQQHADGEAEGEAGEAAPVGAPATPATPPAALRKPAGQLAWSSPGGVVECRMPLFAATQLQGLPAEGRGEAGALSILGGGGGRSRTGIPNAIAAAAPQRAPGAAAGGGVGPASQSPSQSQSQSPSQSVSVLWSAHAGAEAVYALAAHETLPWLCVASAGCLTLWAPPRTPPPADSSSAALAAVAGARARLSLLPPLGALSAGAPSADESAGWEAYAARARADAEAEPREDATAADADGAAAAEFAVVAFGGGRRRAGGGAAAAGGGAVASGGDAVDGGALDGGLLFAGCSDGRVFAFGVAGERSAPRLRLLWARRLPAPPLGGALASCAVVSLCANTPAREAHARLAVCDGVGRLWLWHAAQPAEPAQLAVPAVAPSAARRGRKPVPPKLKTVVLLDAPPPAEPRGGAPAASECVRLLGLISAAGQTTWATAWDVSLAATPHAAAAAAPALAPRRVCAHSHTAAAASADGRFVCVGSGEGCVTLVDGASLRAVGGAQGLHSLPVTAVVALAPADGGRGVDCLSVSADKRALVSRLVPAAHLFGMRAHALAALLLALLALLCALWLAMGR